MTDPAVLQDTWARGLAGLTPGQVGDGLESATRETYPPTLPKFRELCETGQQVPDVESAYVAAVKYASALHRGVTPPKVHPAVYAAAQDFGTHSLLNLSEEVGRKRFAHYYANAKVEFASGIVRAPTPVVPKKLEHGVPGQEEIAFWADVCRRMQPDKAFAEREIPILADVNAGRITHEMYRNGLANRHMDAKKAKYEAAV